MCVATVEGDGRCHHRHRRRRRRRRRRRSVSSPPPSPLQRQRRLASSPLQASESPQASALGVVSQLPTQQASASPPPEHVRVGRRADRDGPDRDDGLAGRGLRRGEVETEVQQVRTLPLDPAVTLCRPAHSVKGPRAGAAVSALASVQGEMVNRELSNGNFTIINGNEQLECYQN